MARSAVVGGGATSLFFGAHYAQDIAFEKDAPIFCTSKSEIVLIKGGVVDDNETQMMSVRWRVYSLYEQIPESEQVTLNSCGKCSKKKEVENKKSTLCQ